MSIVKASLLVCVIVFLFTGCNNQTQFKVMQPDETGLHFRNDIQETEENNVFTYEYFYNGGGIAIGDINNDGLPDIYLSGNSVSNKLYLNKGDWKFEDITAESNAIERKGWKTGVSMVDVNGDGWLDIYLCYSGNGPGEGIKKPVIIDYPGRSKQLFINKGCAKGGVPIFVESAKEYGLDAPGTFSTQAYFLDYDKDGDLDMFLLNHANMFYSTMFNVKKLRSLRHPNFGNKLYRNDDNKFKEVSVQAGIFGSGLNFGLSASISDLNGDNWPDIYVTNDYDEQDFCYLNNRNGTFKEITHTSFGHLSKFGMGSDIADVNNDELPDIFVADMLPEDNHRQKLLKGADEYDKVMLAADSGYHNQYMRNTLQINRGLAPDSLPRFMETGQLSGISNTDWSWAPLLADLDNDGLKDLFVTNGYLRDYTNMDFLKYVMNDAIQKNKSNDRQRDVLGTINKMPSTKLNKYAFKNVDGLHFENHTADWGLTEKAVSNAAAYADLDNDGDLDMIVSNLNDEITVLQNQEDKIQKNNFIKIKLVGKALNASALGAKIYVTTSDRTIFQEAYYTRGYQSSVDPVITIGIGEASAIKKIKILWPNNSVSMAEQVAPNKTMVFNQNESAKVKVPDVTIRTPLLRDISNTSGINFNHKENPYIDFKSQRLLVMQLSRMGGKVAVADVNKDGNDDVFYGGAAGQERMLYLGTDNGTFTPSASQPWNGAKSYEDIGVTFFDADSDGDADLYLVSGGNEYMMGDPYYQDRLFVNDGNGVFTQALDALPSEETSGSCAVAGDYDKDGDLDLFVGGRLAAKNYPLFPKSFLLRNDTKDGKVKFTDVTVQVNEDLSLTGMVTDAIWSDINNDTWPDLMIVGEWMPVRVFINNKGNLTEGTSSYGLAKSHGWWSTISQVDVDGDGDIDFLLGNAGTNLQLHASPENPLQCYMQDIDSDGAIDPILCYYIQGKSYPLPTRDELLEQVAPLKKKFIKYADYADATIQDIISQEQLTKSYIYSAETLQSCWLENNGDGKFNLKPLPDLAQVSMINGFVADDFDGDGVNEVLAAGNFYPYRVLLGKSDASSGILLKFGAGEAKVYNYDSPLWLEGDIRDLAIARFKNGKKILVVARNNDQSSQYEIVKRPKIVSK
ncbi:MAG TPA: VCBS repeat-containing protein [Cyclobacteriaceae bacterium]|jgi:hypothetical protein|nr:VCBS repeat-containing protein [Cyclobacteriaceae bacterium]